MLNCLNHKDIYIGYSNENIIPLEVNEVYVLIDEQVRNICKKKIIFSLNYIYNLVNYR